MDESKGSISKDDLEFVTKYLGYVREINQYNMPKQIFSRVLLFAIGSVMVLFGLNGLFHGDAAGLYGLFGILLIWGTVLVTIEDSKNRTFLKTNKGKCLALLDAYKEHLRIEKIRVEREAEIKKKNYEEQLKKKQFWKSLSGREFEHKVAELLRMQGVSVIVTKATGDQGVDLIINDAIIVQCKNHAKPIGRPDFQKLYGELMHHGSRYKRAFMITTSGASNEAKRWISDKPITLLDLESIVNIAEGRLDFKSFCA